VSAQDDDASLAELITDCTDLPADLCVTRSGLPLSRLAAKWAVSDANVAAVRELDEYV
jgi:hypothetical protein